MRVHRRRGVGCVLAGLWIGGCGLLSAQEATVLAAPPRLQPKWGTQDLGVRTVHGRGFFPSHSTITYSYNDATSHRFRTGGGASLFDAGLPDLPAGALITGLELEACDSSGPGRVIAYLRSRQSPIGPAENLGEVATGIFGGGETPGCNFFGGPTNLITVGHIVDNFNHTYRLSVALEAEDDSTSLGAVRVYYQLQVSPAPAEATFGDVPTTHGFFQFVEALAASGITAGCGSGNFCPDAPLTRGQMAVFLSKALGLHFPY